MFIFAFGIVSFFVFCATFAITFAYVLRLYFLLVLDLLVTGILLKAGLGYTVENMTLYYGASILIGITFMSIIQFLIRNFGDIGKFLALIVLVLQLAAAGGTFPIETIDKGFQAISPYLPMTYSIKLLREILVPTASNYKMNYILILLGIKILLESVFLNILSPFSATAPESSSYLSLDCLKSSS